MDGTQIAVAVIGLAAAIGAAVLPNVQLRKIHQKVAGVENSVNHVGPDGATLTDRVDMVLQQGERTLEAVGRVSGQLVSHERQDEHRFSEIDTGLVVLNGTLKELTALRAMLREGGHAMPPSGKD